jgi:hypothetical protein
MLPTEVLLGHLTGAVIGALVLVNIFRLMAGVRFSSFRQIATAYLVYFLAAVPIEAFVSEHPLEPYKASVYAFGSVVSSILELIRLRRRTIVDSPQHRVCNSVNFIEDPERFAVRHMFFGPPPAIILALDHHDVRLPDRLMQRNDRLASARDLQDPQRGFMSRSVTLLSSGRSVCLIRATPAGCVR